MLKRWIHAALITLAAAFTIAPARAEAAQPPHPDCADQESGISIILRISFFYVLDGGVEGPTMVVVVSGDSFQKLYTGLRCRGAKPGLVRIDGTSLKMRLTVDDAGRIVSGYLLPSGQPVYVVSESHAASKDPQSQIHLQPLYNGKLTDR